MFEDKQNLKEDLLAFVERHQEILESTEHIPNRAIWFDVDRQHATMLMLITGQNADSETVVPWALKAVSSTSPMADLLMFFNDAYWSDSETRADGTPWDENGLEQAFINNEESVYEAQFIFTADRHGNLGLFVLPYLRTEDGIQFQPDLVEDGTERLAGAFPVISDWIDDAMSQVTIWDAESADPDLKAIRDIQDIRDEKNEFIVSCVGAVEVTNSMGFPILINAVTDEEREITLKVVAQAEGVGSVDGKTQDLQQVLDLERLYHK